MYKTQYDQSFYTLQHAAVNKPKQFIADFNLTPSKLRLHPSYVWKLLYAKAQLTLGEVKSAMELLSSLKTAIHEAQDTFCMGKYYLTLYNTQTNISGVSSQSEEYYRLADKYVKQSGSRALRCEQKILLSQKADTDLGLELKKTLLEEAMQDAIEADILDLKLEVYLAYCPLYLSNNLPEPANRELMLLADLVKKEQNPYLYIQLHIYQSIVHLMLKEFAKAEECLTLGIATAKEHGSKALLVPLLMNLGLYFVNSGNVAKGIEKYRESLALMEECGLEQSVNAIKTQDNLARALGRMNRLDEAVLLIRASLESCIRNKNKLRENILNVNLADIIIEQEAFTEAEQYLDTAIEYFTREKIYLYLTSAYRCKARMYEAMENYQKAFEMMELLDNSSQRHFFDNFNKQAVQHRVQMDKLHSEYLLIKNQCTESHELSRLCLNTELLGEHPTVKTAIKNAFMAAKYPFVNVFITGESGTGKEVIARIIHNESKTGKPLVAVNASAISPHLIESELFGHKKGAFTGAVDDRRGKFLMADKGTLFLDEISEMPVEAQVKLLRAIETHIIQPVGSDKEIAVNCRIISTSNCVMKDLIHSNKFRLDLFHRLNKIEIHLIPLRERLSDLELLTMHFVKRFSAEFRVPIPTITESFYKRLEGYSFPGNIRELINIVERIYILKPKPVWNADQLEGMFPDKPAPEKLEMKAITQHLKSTESQLIEEVLASCNWVQKEAAKLLDMSESTLSRHIKKLKIIRQ